MRIIAGTHKGRPLMSPKGCDTTRPITDRAKENLFNRLQSYGMFADEGESWHVADVFSGTGSMGVECLSRGAKSACFVDRDKYARMAIEQNLKTFGWYDRCAIHGSDACTGLWIANKIYRLIFLDPPYPLMRDAGFQKRMVALMSSCLHALEPGGMMVLRAGEASSLPQIPECDILHFQVGSMDFCLYQKPLPE